MKRVLLVSVLFISSILHCSAQTTDTSKQSSTNIVHIYFMISAGDKINAYFNDKPLNLETISEFNEYIQTNIKSLKDSWVVVTGKPKNGTFDEVIKTLSRYRFKHVTKNIQNN